MSIVTILAGGLMLIQSWCSGDYHPAFGTNFGSCQAVDYSGSVQAPGDDAGNAGK